GGRDPGGSELSGRGAQETGGAGEEASGEEGEGREEGGRDEEAKPSRVLTVERAEAVGAPGTVAAATPPWLCSVAPMTTRLCLLTPDAALALPAARVRLLRRTCDGL